MATSSIPQNTDFTRDVLGRYLCNGLDEAFAGSDLSLDPSGRPFDVIVVGGGSFGPILAQQLLYSSRARSRHVGRRLRSTSPTISTFAVILGADDFKQGDTNDLT